MSRAPQLEASPPAVDRIAAGALALGPVAVLPLVAAALFWNSPAWQLVWGLSLAIYAGLKWFTFAASPPPREVSIPRVLGYLFAWPGMDARAFWDREAVVPTPAASEWLLAVSKLGCGAALATLAVPWLLPDQPLVAGVVAMIAVALTLHFGLFHLLSLAWRTAGVQAEPIMQWPIAAASVGEFWGRRWNRAFRDLAFTHALRPLAPRWGATSATLAVFLLSGLVHELVITLPVGGGHGGPTLYFLVQGAAILAERSDWGKRFGLGEGIAGRLFALLMVLGPVGLLFPEAFVREGVLPLVTAALSSFPHWHHG